MGFMAAKYLFVASEIGVFEKLASGPLILDALAAATGIPPRTLRISADAMVSLGLLERVDARYRNSAAAAAFLAGAPGPDLRPMLRFWDKLSYPGWINLESAVRNGRGQAGFFRFNEEEQQIFSTGVEAFSAPAAAALAMGYDFGRHRRILDVAGGTGSFLIAILRRHAALCGTLFELAGTCAVARRRLAREPEGARIVGARLLLVDLWMDASRTQPPAAPVMAGEFLIHAGDGQSYAEDEADAWLAQTDWRKLERRPLAGPASVIIAEAA
ncbi:MAG: hypothetical protein JOZ17_25740 [Acetobacteraceae bacterium]|nr:hypothetical protein [Acetobacteraceae bacterium]